ncbi:MAG TPA: immunoglobulin domain-containing protein [Opitutaceae bacterium]|nr:immunoglobulin domain-containing protein [Opitutaceae bacterium]
MKKILSTACLALLGLALPASAQVQANFNDLILGFRATGGQGQNVNLEVDLGSVALYTNPASSPMVVGRLALADLTSTYGSTWNARTDLVWGIVGTAGRISTGPTGQPAATLWASRTETTAGTPSTPWTPGSRNAQTNASASIETLFLGAPGSLNGASASPNSTFSALVTATLSGSYSVQDTFQAGTSFGFFNPSIDGAATVGGTSYAVLDLYELQPGAASATYVGSFGLSANGTLTFSKSAGYFAGGAAAAPAVSSQPTSQSVAAGGGVTLTAVATGSPTFTWQQNGTTISNATNATLNLAIVQPANVGVYTAIATNSSGTISTQPAIVGVTTTSGVIGTGTIALANQQHPNGNFYKQVLVTGSALAVSNAAPQITRTSFIDMNDDIVQVEFSGAGTLSFVFDGASAPAEPVNYSQAGTQYVKGHVGIVIAGADDTSNLSIFTVGRATAFDPTGGFNILLPVSATNNPANNGSSLFTGHATTSYDGVADIAFVAISSTNGKFGGLRTADATYWNTKGITGVYAPSVEFTGPVYVGDINAKTDATPYLVIGKSDVEVRITGGDLKQDNGRAVQVSGITQIHFKDGSTSGAVTLTAQANKGQLVQGSTDVTSQLVLAPGL